MYKIQFTVHSNNSTSRAVYNPGLCLQPGYTVAGPLKAVDVEIGCSDDRLLVSVCALCSPLPAVADLHNAAETSALWLRQVVCCGRYPLQHASGKRRKCLMLEDTLVRKQA